MLIKINFQLEYIVKLIVRLKVIFKSEIKKLFYIINDLIRVYLLILGRIELIDKFLEDEVMKVQKFVVEGLEDLRVLFKYFELYGIIDKVYVCIE